MMKSQMCQYRVMVPDKRGFTSLNEAVIIMSTDTGKVLDVEVMSRYCNTCVMHGKLRLTDPAKYEQYQLSHEWHKHNEVSTILGALFHVPLVMNGTIIANVEQKVGANSNKISPIKQQPILLGLGYQRTSLNM